MATATNEIAAMFFFMGGVVPQARRAEYALGVEHFVVGDVQGCHQELADLMAAAGFDRARHRLTFVGGLVNRGPQQAAPF